MPFLGLLFLNRVLNNGEMEKIPCKTWENSNFLKNGKTVISIKIRNFSRSWMTKQTSPLESFCEI